MLLAADLAGDVDQDLAGREAGAEPVVVYGHDVRAAVRDDLQKAHETAGGVRERGGELYPPVPRDEAELDDAVDEADVYVAAGEEADGLFLGGLELAGEDRGDGARAGGLDDLLRALHEQEDGGGDVVVGDGDEVVRVLHDLGDGLFPGAFDGDAVRDGGDALGGDALTLVEAAPDGVGALRLDADDADARVHLLYAGGDAREQPAPADGYDDGVHRGQLAEYLEADCPLPGHDLVVVEGVEEGGVLLAADLHGLFKGVVVAVAAEDDLRAVALRGLDLGDGRGLGHDDGRGQAVALCGVGHALGVVAGGGCHDGLHLAALRQRAYLVRRAADLEGAGLLPVLALHPDLAARHAAEGGAVVEVRPVDDALQALCRPLEVSQAEFHVVTPRNSDLLYLTL